MLHCSPRGLLHSTCLPPCTAAQPRSQLCISCAATSPAREPFRRPSLQQGLDNKLPLDQLPVPQGEWKAHIPIIGESLDYFGNHQQWLHDRVLKFGPVFRTSLLGYPGYVITSFDAIEQVYNEIHKSTIQFHPESFVDLMGADGMVQMTFHKEAHQKLRRQLGAAMTGDAIGSYLPAIEELARTYTSKWAQMESFDISVALKELTMDFSADLVLGMGLDTDRKTALKQQFQNFTKNLYTFKVDLPGTPFNTAKKAKRELLELMKGHVTAVRERAIARQQGTGRKTALQNYLSAMIEEGGEVDSVRKLSEVCLDLLVAGYDTSAWSMLSLMVLLPQLPERVLQKLQDEQAAILSKHGDAITKDALAEMKYTDAVVREALRLKGPISLLMKKTLVDVEMYGKRIPADSLIFLGISYALDTDHKVVPDDQLSTLPVPKARDIYDLENAFVPERWLNPQTAPTSHGQFGAGMHSCLGAPLYTAEAKVLLSIITRHYDFSLVKAGRVEWLPGIHIATKEPVLMRLRPRSTPMGTVQSAEERVLSDADKPTELVTL